MNFKALLLVAATAATTIAAPAMARGVTPFHTTCSFNNVREACIVREGHDYIDVTYTADGKQVTYIKDHGTSHGQGEVIDGNRTYRAQYGEDPTGSVAFVTTQNGVTRIPLRPL